jgi:hypothetical protein
MQIASPLYGIKGSGEMRGALSYKGSLHRRLGVIDLYFGTIHRN